MWPANSRTQAMYGHFGECNLVILTGWPQFHCTCKHNYTYFVTGFAIPTLSRYALNWIVYSNSVFRSTQVYVWQGILTSSSDNEPFFSSILAANLLTSPTMFLAYGNKKTIMFFYALQHCIQRTQRTQQRKGNHISPNYMSGRYWHTRNRIRNPQIPQLYLPYQWVHQGLWTPE